MVLEHPGLIDPPNPTETKDYTLLQCKSIVFGWTYELEYGEKDLIVTIACSLATLIFSNSVCFQFSGFQVFKNIPGSQILSDIQTFFNSIFHNNSESPMY